MNLTHLFKQVITVENPHNVIDSSGGPVSEKFNNVPSYTDVYASVQPISSSEKRNLAQRKIYTTHRIYVDQDVKVKSNSRILLAATGQKFRVTGYFNMAGQDRVWCIEAEETT